MDLDSLAAAAGQDNVANLAAAAGVTSVADVAGMAGASEEILSSCCEEGCIEKALAE